jgi:hypothetical protein
MAAQCSAPSTTAGDWPQTPSPLSDNLRATQAHHSKIQSISALEPMELAAAYQITLTRLCPPLLTISNQLLNIIVTIKHDG